MAIQKISESIRSNKQVYHLDFSLKEKTEVFTNDLFYILFDTNTTLAEHIDSLAASFKEITDVSCKHDNFDYHQAWKKFLICLPEILKQLNQDANYMYQHDPASTSIEEVILAYPGFYAIAVYRLSNISAGIGRGQMMVLDDHVAARRRIYERYSDDLGRHESIEFLAEPAGHYSNRWLTCILLPDRARRDHLMNVLSGENIESRPLWKPLHLQPVFREAPFYGGNTAESLFLRGLCLPSGSDLKKQVQDHIISLILSNI